MTVEVTPMNVQCQLSCTYCYQVPMRDAGNAGTRDYDMEAMKRAILATGQAFTVFGGEPLLVPIEDIEELFRFGLEQYHIRAAKSQQRHGPNGIQTNGALITAAHVDLFKKYSVHVGFSMDGPADLNDSRWAGTLDKTREATARSQNAMEWLLAEGIGTSLILTLHKGNAGTPDKVRRIKNWLLALQARGLSSCRLHILEVDNVEVGKELELTQQENVSLFLDMARFEAELAVSPAPAGPITFDIFADIEKLLNDDQNVTCTWSPCDPYTTSAVHGIDGQGNLSNCGRTNKDGVAWLKADQTSRERQFALYNTPQDQGGCQGCRFFLQCKGQCPGTAIDGDWRNKSRDCATWMALLEFKERELLNRGVIPQSVAPGRLEREARYLDQLWAGAGDNKPHGDHWDSVGNEHGDRHGDHTDAALAHVPAGAHGDADHGDHTDASLNKPHGDSHGDHTDIALVVQGNTEHGDAPHGDHTDNPRPILEQVRRAA